MAQISVGDNVKFTNPMQDEIGLTMKVLEVNGDRLLVEYNVDMHIKPSGIVLVADVEKC